MAYLSIDDYTLSISLDNLNEILAQAAANSGRDTDAIRAFAESYARGYITSKLKAKYNIDAEFAKDSSDQQRDILITGAVIDLVLCTIHNTINPRDIPELRQKRCEATVAWLNEVRDGDALLINVPLLPDPDQEHRTFIDSQGGVTKFISKPYQDREILNSTNPIPPNFLL